jgi:hypothetical protein
MAPGVAWLLELLPFAAIDAAIAAPDPDNEEEEEEGDDDDDGDDDDGDDDDSDDEVFDCASGAKHERAIQSTGGGP